MGNATKSAGGNAGANAVKSVLLANNKGSRYYHYESALPSPRPTRLQNNGGQADFTMLSAFQ
ncbi:MAG: hypothetical protein Q9M92_18075 [Enterobacterales bacterium]|nr:hypothetical protein [Enterobacterales bacterium]